MYTLPVLGINTPVGSADDRRFVVDGELGSGDGGGGGDGGGNGGDGGRGGSGGGDGGGGGGGNGGMGGKSLILRAVVDL